MIELDSYRQQLTQIRENIAKVGEALNIEGLKEQLMELNETMNEPDFWNDLERSTSITKKARTIEGKLEHFGKLGQRAEDIEATMELAEEMEDDDLVAEVKETNLEQAKAAGGPSGPKHAAKKVGRNDPCPCGSGKKYKQCCGREA